MNPLNFSGRKKFFCFLFFVFQTIQVFAQNFEIDSLQVVLKKMEEDTGKVNTLNNLARAFIKVHIPEVKTYAEEGLELSGKIHYIKGEAEANRLLGLTYLIEKTNASALQHFAEALNRFQKISDKRHEVLVLDDIALFYLSQNDNEQSLSYLEEALTKSLSYGTKIGEGYTRLLFARLYIREREIKKAGKELNQGMDLAMNLKDNDLIAFFQYQKASLLKEEKQFSDCLPILNKNLLYYEQTGNLLEQFYTQELIGQVYLDLKQYDKAHIYFDACQNLSHGYGSTNLLSRTLRNQSNLDSMKGDFKQALRHYSQFMKLKDSLNRTESDRQAVLFESRFANERKSKENQLLILQQSKNKIIIQQQFLGLFILFLALIGLVIILIKLQRLNAQNKHSLEEVLVKNQEIVFKNKIIEEQRLKQEKINLVKDKLFSVISHDMRTPLTQLQGILGLMEVNALKMSEWVDLLPALKRNVQTSTEQLDTLLLWSKNQMQGFQPHITQFLIYPLADKNISLLKGPLEEKEIQYKNTIDRELLIEADLEMIQIVIRNLLTNAIKFTQNKGNIWLSSYVNSTHAFIKVMDTGVGIREEDYTKVFEEIDFTTPGTLGEKGTGLGLKLCKDFIEMNGGEIHVESILNQGSQFIFSIPLAKTKKYRFSREVK